MKESSLDVALQPGLEEEAVISGTGRGGDTRPCCCQHFQRFAPRRGGGGGGGGLLHRQGACSGAVSE